MPTEDFLQYKKASMVIAMPQCDFKCNKDAGKIVCQNYELRKSKTIKVKTNNIIERYLSNPITSAIVFAGLEPLYKKDIDGRIEGSYLDVINFIEELRSKYNCMDDIVIYSGYTIDEIITDERMALLEKLTVIYPEGKIILKVGRYIPDLESVDDPILGVKLASSNQYAIDVNEYRLSRKQYIYPSFIPNQIAEY